MSKTSQELLSQPDCWRTAAARAGNGADAGDGADGRSGRLLPAPGQRIALAGCGTSRYMAQAMAAWREAQGDGVTDAFAASEMPASRSYDLVIAISRSGTTTEVVQLANELRQNGNRVLAITAIPGMPVADAADAVIDLPFADEASVVQTRFATSVCALWRAHLGHDVSKLADEAEAALNVADEQDLGKFRQFVFLGRGAGAALASEAALKFGESALAWSEAYPAMEFRHGPISVIGEHTLVWAIGHLDEDLAAQIEQAGATVRRSAGDPMVDLVTVHRAAVTLAEAKGLNPDQPQRLTRSVILA
ncbi:MAG TPA: SIS domain-containing protein [Streptosporangiaceae bacterium]